MKNFALLLAMMFVLSSFVSTKVAQDPNAQFMGEWEYVVVGLPIDIDGTMELSSEDGVIKVVLSNPQGDWELEEVTLVDGSFEAVLEAGGGLHDLEGKFEGKNFNGHFYMGGETEFVMTAKKLK